MWCLASPYLDTIEAVASEKTQHLFFSFLHPLISIQHTDKILKEVKGYQARGKYFLKKKIFCRITISGNPKNAGTPQFFYCRIGQNHLFIAASVQKTPFYCRIGQKTPNLSFLWGKMRKFKLFW